MLAALVVAIIVARSRARVAVAMGTPGTIRVTGRWTDGAGEHEEPFTLKVA